MFPWNPMKSPLNRCDFRPLFSLHLQPAALRRRSGVQRGEACEAGCSEKALGFHGVHQKMKVDTRWNLQKVGDVCDHQCVFLGDLWEMRERKVMYFEEFSGFLGIWWWDFRDVYGFIGTSWREFTLTNNSSDPHSRDCNFTSKNGATCKMWGIHQNSSHPLNIEQPHSMVPMMWKFPTKNHGFV